MPIVTTMNEARRAEAEEHWLQPHSDAWLAHYRESIQEPYRRDVWNALQALRPFATALDVGCNCGTLVPCIEDASAAVRITGVDLSVQAITEARRLWPTHIWVQASMVDWLPMMAMGGRTWDIVLSSSALCCVAPADMDGVLAALAQVASRALVLHEVVVTTRQPTERLSTNGSVEYLYDYPKRLDAIGWKLATCVWQQIETNRPVAIMTFVKETPIR